MLDRRRMLMANSQGGYVENGLVCWVDGILNQGNIPEDQKGNYTITSQATSPVKNGDIIQFANSACVVPCGAVTDTNSFTINIVAKRRSTNIPSMLWSILPYDTTYPNGRANLGYVTSGASSLRFFQNQYPDSNFFLYSSSWLNTDVTDYHSCDVTFEDKSIKVYVDGVLSVSGTETRTFQTNLPIVIGAYTPRETCFANIDLLSFKLYNRPLTADDIAQNYATDKARFNL